MAGSTFCCLLQEVIYFQMLDYLDSLLSSSRLNIIQKLRLKYSKISSLMDLAFDEEFFELLDKFALIVKTFFSNDMEV